MYSKNCQILMYCDLFYQSLESSIPCVNFLMTCLFFQSLKLSRSQYLNGLSVCCHTTRVQHAHGNIGLVDIQKGLIVTLVHALASTTTTITPLLLSITLHHGRPIDRIHPDLTSAPQQCKHTPQAHQHLSPCSNHLVQLMSQFFFQFS
jgi:hypothetical protein